MKLFIIAATALFSLFFGRSIYEISIEKLEGKQQYLSEYRGKKMLIALITDPAVEVGILQCLDSIQNVHGDSLVVIAVPAIDFEPGAAQDSLPTKKEVNDRKLLKELKDSLKLDLLIAKPVRVKKSSGGRQHALFNWLTHASENIHFDEEITEGGQLFLVSEKGQLYAQLDWKVPPDIINEVIIRDYDE